MMQTFVIREASDLAGLTAKLVDKRSANASATLDRVKAMNPHVDFSKLKAGTVLILPDDPGLKRSDKDIQPFGAWALQEFAQAADQAFVSAAERIKANAETASGDRNALATSLRTNAVKRQAEGDPALAAQLQEVASASADEQKALSQATSDLETLRKSFAQEMAAMTKLLS
jgi:hypothetical protein